MKKKHVFVNILVFTSLLLSTYTSSSAAQIEKVIKDDNKIYVLGNGFDPAKQYTVDFNGIRAKAITESSKILTLDLPDNAKRGRILVLESDGTPVAISEKEYAFSKAAITALSTTTAPLGGTIVIRGIGFDKERENNEVFFGSKQAKVIEGNETLLAVTVPEGAKAGPITWKSKITEATATSEISFHPPEPTIISFDPQKGPEKSKVQITGTNFTNDTRVFFPNHVEATIVNKSLPTLLVVEVPVKATDGPITLIDSNEEYPSKRAFKITGPELTFRPSHGVPGTTVLISGMDFDQHNNKVSFNGLKAEVVTKQNLGLDHPPHRLIVKVPAEAIPGPVSVSVTTSERSHTTSKNFLVDDPQQGIHIYGGGTVNFFKRTNDGTAADLEPHFGLVGVHKLKARPWWFSPDTLDGQFLATMDLSYRGVTAEEDKTNLKALATAKSIGWLTNFYYSIYKSDTHSFGADAAGGVEFLTGDAFNRDAQYSYGAYLRFQDDEDPLYFGQVGWGKAEYLKKNRLLIEACFPLWESLMGGKKQLSFYNKNYTDFYFFLNANVSTEGKKDDSLVFGIKAVLSVTKTLGLFNPNDSVAQNADKINKQ